MSAVSGIAPIGISLPLTAVVASPVSTGNGAGAEETPGRVVESDRIELTGLTPPAPEATTESDGPGSESDETSARAPGADSGRESQPNEAEAQRSSSENTAEGEELTEEEQSEVRELEDRDREVRQHEQAHMAAGGQYTRGAPSYDYQTGPDGQRYAVGGKVSVDTAAERTPEATISKAQTIRRAALAPADPSAADRAIAANASRMEAQARQELQQQQQTSGSSQPSSADRPEAATFGPMAATERPAAEGSTAGVAGASQADDTEETVSAGIPPVSSFEQPEESPLANSFSNAAVPNAYEQSEQLGSVLDLVM